MTRLLLSLSTLALLATGAVAPSTASAQGYEDLDSADDGKKKRDRGSVMAELEDEVIREIVRGFYVKTGVGGGMYFGRYGVVQTPSGSTSILRSVTTTPITIGQDFVDNERNSMAWEVSITQAVYNGMSFETQAAIGLPAQRLIQGDSRLFQFTGSYEYSVYPSRRLGLGVRLGAGVMLAPLLMDREAYERDVVGDAWNGAQSPAHSRPHPMAFIGPTLEYYTKLSHFSVGVDVDVAYQLDFDLNVSGVGYMKYTF